MRLLLLGTFAIILCDAATPLTRLAAPLTRLAHLAQTKLLEARILPERLRTIACAVALLLNALVLRLQAPLKSHKACSSLGGAVPGAPVPRHSYCFR